MTTKTRKHTAMIRQLGVETRIFEQERKWILSAIRRYSTVLCMLMALCALTRAQSTDPANPTPITAKQVEGKATGSGATYYYRFSAKTGTVKVTLRGQTNNYATQFEADLTNSGGADLGKIYVSASDQAKQAFKVFSFDSDQSVNIVVKLSKDETLKWQYYRITLAEVPEPSADGGQAAPAQQAPDLVVTEIIFEPSPAKIRVRVMNIGSGASTACFLALISGASDDSSLGTKKRVWSLQVPALEPGKGFSGDIDVSPLTQTNGPWKATIDRSNTVKESNESNNSTSSNAPSTSDADITANIKGRFAQDQDLSVANLSVDTSNGVVTLQGSVAKEAIRSRAQTFAQNTKAVKKVINLIKIKP